MFKGKFFTYLFILIFFVPLAGSGCIFGTDEAEDNAPPPANNVPPTDNTPPANISGNETDPNNISGSQS